MGCLRVDISIPLRNHSQGRIRQYSFISKNVANGVRVLLKLRFIQSPSNILTAGYAHAVSYSIGNAHAVFYLMDIIALEIEHSYRSLFNNGFIMGLISMGTDPFEILSIFSVFSQNFAPLENRKTLMQRIFKFSLNL